MAGAIETKRPIYKVRIVYKSGYTHDFNVFNFTMTQSADGKKYSWENADNKNQPIILGADDIVAVWQIGVEE